MKFYNHTTYLLNVVNAKKRRNDRNNWDKTYTSDRLWPGLSETNIAPGTTQAKPKANTSYSM